MATDTRPTDLLPLADAAPLVDRSVSSLRAWLRAGRLVKYREVEDDPGSRVLVSRGELMTLAASELAAAPGRPAPGRPKAPAPVAVEGDLPALEATRLAAELSGVRSLLELTREHLADLRRSREREVEAERRTAEAEKARADALARELEEARAELAALRAAAELWRESAALPWWRRLLAGPARLSGPDDA